MPAMSPASEPLRLSTLLATYPHTAPLKNGNVTSARVALDFKDVTPVWSGFKAMVRRQEFDVSETRVVTHPVPKTLRKPTRPPPSPITRRNPDPPGPFTRPPATRTAPALPRHTGPNPPSPPP